MATSCNILTLFLFISLAFTFQTISSNNNTDFLSLLAFKNAITHDPFGALNSWNETIPLCTWKGIRCGLRHPDRVISVNLTSQGLVGPLSPFIANMSFLHAINLANNSFHGIIPNEIGCLRRLELVDFSINSFNGLIPSNISRCLNLSNLRLQNNQLYGTIPPELGHLYKLEYLGLGHNNLSWRVPPSIGNMTFLTTLFLESCYFEGEIPESLGHLRNLKSLRLSINRLNGTIPSALWNMSSILIFDLSGNDLQGTLPSSMGFTLPNLSFFSVFQNLLSGLIPSSLANASALEVIELSMNYFHGQIPMLGNLGHLRFLVMSFCNIEDDIRFISQLENCTHLEVLSIGDNLISGVLPKSIGNLSSKLKFLSIQDTQVRGNIPSSIGELFGLTSFSLGGSNLEGFIPSSIGKLSNLHVLELGGNRFTGELPYSIGNLTSLTKFSLRSNKIFGSIPKSLYYCKNLLVLNISQNNFSGSIPSEIMNLSSISEFLDLSSNALSGSLPPEIQSLTHLSTLDVSNNRLTGVIPNSISGCVSLIRLRLEGNLFEGEIPQGFIALKGLQDLDLSRNHFSGLIPSFLSQLQFERLNLSFNMLNGEVPILGVFANQSAISVEGNKNLCGGIPQMKLPLCPLQSFSKKNSPTLLKILIPIGILFFLCLVIFSYMKRKPTKDSPLPHNFGSPKFMRLSYADLGRATNGFSETNLVGIGRFGSVYKGILNDGQTSIAVKVLNLHVPGASKTFLNECTALRNIRHRNLLKILSVCESIDFNGNNFRALVYELKENGSLEKWLHRNMDIEKDSADKLNSLDITQRLNIAIDIAHALEYLHYGTESTIIHGDLKPSNILLDHHMTACVGDFGLAKVVSSIIPPHVGNSSIGIKGTIGYVPPEYGTNNFVSTQGDAYSYGILLLEMFTNRRPIDDLFKDHLNLHNFVIANLPGSMEEIVNPLAGIGGLNWNDEKVMNIMASVLNIGVACSKEDPKDRLSMAEVVYELGKLKSC